MIARHWKGIAKPGLGSTYKRHLLAETFPGLSKIQGFIKASILKRAVPGGEEFLIITEWDSVQAIEAFAGEDAESAVVPAKVQEMMVEYDKKATHYEIAHQQ